MKDVPSSQLKRAFQEDAMQRRKFLRRLGGGALAAGAALGIGCKQKEAVEQTAVTGSSSFKPVQWKMVTTWPKNFPGLGTGANFMADLITRMSGGRIQVKVYGAKELVPAFEVFDAVSRGTAELGHGAAYYWKGKSEAAQFFSAVPFGHLQGLKMRIPGLGGEVLARAGGTPVSLPGGELFTSLQSGAIDATEWVGPYNDLAFGLYKAAKYYYYPGWHEPGTTLECMVNKQAYDALPEELQVIVDNAARVANQDMFAEYMARNNQALQTLVNEHKVDVRKLPDEVIDRLRELSETVVAEVAQKDALSQRVYDSFRAFRQQVVEWQNISERAYLNARTG
jgi:TRAP-type mannitol/chloroaromatic compound transport system substrate-binding protein